MAKRKYLQKSVIKEFISSATCKHLLQTSTNQTTDFLKGLNRLFTRPVQGWHAGTHSAPLLSGAKGSDGPAVHGGSQVPVSSQ